MATSNSENRSDIKKNMETVRAAMGAKENLTIRIPSETKYAFDKSCTNIGSKMSIELRRFIHSFIKKHG